jgi:hypothetical protein
MLVIAATMLLEGVSPKAPCPSMIDSKLDFLFLFTPSSKGGRDAAVFEIVADAYSARRGATFCLSGLVIFRLGRLLVFVVDNLPLSIFFLHMLRQTIFSIIGSTGGCLVGIWEN